jgi:quercetin dioxygenase-like cupin family protein
MSAVIEDRPEVTREHIERLEGYLAALPQVSIPPVHRFAPGLYVREIAIPAGTLMTGKAHLTDHVSIMLSGRMTVRTEQGMQTLEGPNVFISPAGTKRVGYAHTDVRWVTVHRNDDDTQDIQLIESRLVEPWSLETALQKAAEASCLS